LAAAAKKKKKDDSKDPLRIHDEREKEAILRQERTKEE
jgi:hypothetical protein